jgi:hypothetical protein
MKMLPGTPNLFNIAQKYQALYMNIAVCVIWLPTESRMARQYTERTAVLQLQGAQRFTCTILTPTCCTSLPDN